MPICDTIEGEGTAPSKNERRWLRLPRLKTQPNLRQAYREAVERANNIGIDAKLARGYLYFTDEISDPEHITKEKLWADAKNLHRLRKIVDTGELIAAERQDVISALKEIEIFARARGIKIGPLGEDAWYFYYETVDGKTFLPFTRASKGRIYALILSAK